MKNLKVTLKFIVSFLIVAVFMTVVGIVGITGMARIEQSGEQIYKNAVQPMPYLARVQETFQNMRVYVREMVIASMADDMEKVESSYNVITGLMFDMEENLDKYNNTLQNGSEAKRLFDEARFSYENEFTKTVLSIYEASKTANTSVIFENMEKCRELSDKILTNFDSCLDLKVIQAEKTSQESTSLALTLLIIIITVLIIALGAAIFFMVYIPRQPQSGFSEVAFIEIE